MLGAVVLCRARLVASLRSLSFILAQMDLCSFVFFYVS